MHGAAHAQAQGDNAGGVDQDWDGHDLSGSQRGTAEKVDQKRAGRSFGKRLFGYPSVANSTISNPRRFEPRLSVATDQPFGFAPDPSFNPSRLGFVKLHSLTSRSVVKNDGQYLPRLNRTRPSRPRLQPVRSPGCTPTACSWRVRAR